MDTNNSSFQQLESLHHQNSNSLDEMDSQLSPSSVDSHELNDDILVTLNSPSKTNGVDTSDSTVQLETNPAAQSQLEHMWQQLESTMANSHDSVRDRLMEYGVGEGEEDSESEEGQLWSMVQGDSPYTIEV